MKKYLSLIEKTIKQWLKNKAFERSAIIAYYTLFSLPSFLVVIISFAGYFFGKSMVQSQIIQQLGEIVGVETASFIERLITNVSISDSSSVGLLISIGVLLFGATGAFFHLKKTMNIIWRVREKKSNLGMMILNRVISLGMIFIIGFLLIASLIANTLVATLGDYLNQFAPNLSALGLQVVNYALSFVFLTCLFSIIITWLPDVKIRWRISFIGASFTSILFLIAVYGLGIYFVKTDPSSIFGGASSIILIMLWVYYSCLVLFLGAEFTVQYALFKKEKIGSSRFSEPAVFKLIEDLQKEKLHFKEREDLYQAYKERLPKD